MELNTNLKSEHKAVKHLKEKEKMPETLGCSEFLFEGLLSRDAEGKGTRVYERQYTAILLQGTADYNSTLNLALCGDI